MSYKNIKNLDSVLEESKSSMVFILKHSNTCPISAAAKSEVDKFVKKNIVYILIVQQERALSNRIAEVLGITHESPQLLFIKNRKVVKVLNHSDIILEKIKL